jgi:hypothetical protein
MDTNFTCEVHGLIGRADHCPRCWEIANDKVKGEEWQQPTPTLLEPDHSYYLGISKLEAAINQILLQRSAVAGICCDLLTSFPKNTGIETTERQSEVFASFARLMPELEDLLSHVNIVAKNSLRYPSMSVPNTSVSGKQPKN